jgi:cytochrome c
MKGTAISTAAMVLALLVSPAAPQNPAGDNAEKLIKASDCSSCHAIDRAVVGPAYSAVAKRYAGQPEAASKLVAKIRAGGGGMTPHADLSEPQLNEIVKWVLSQKDTAPVPPSDVKQYPYALKDGTTVQLDFQLFNGPKVTKEVFHGYQLYNSYCYRCHGTDATGGQLAPDLRRTLTTGMKQQGFLSVAMEGKKEQGMPAWAGFLSEDDVIHIFKYVKGRSLDLISVGRPPSEQD